MSMCSVVSDSLRPGSSIHGVFQARILEWVAISFSREFPQGGFAYTFIKDIDLYFFSEIFFLFGPQGNIVPYNELKIVPSSSVF